MNFKYPNFWQHKSLISTLLLPFSYLYFLAYFVRKMLVKPVIFKAKVICVGNITVGGTGKTQVVELIAKHFLAQEKKVLIICKGYNSKISKHYAELVKDYHSAIYVGDEAKYLSQIAPVIASSNTKNAQNLVAKHAPDIIILDDFLQNPGVIKNINILTVDTDRMFGNNRLIPAGPLRQSFESAKLDNTFIMAIGSGDNIPTELPQESFVAQIISNQKLDLAQKYLAFAGIGNPQRFFNCLKLHGLNICQEIIFPDHYIYNDADLSYLQCLAKDSGAKLITTPKDAIKLSISVDVFQPDLKFIQKSAQELIRAINFGVTK